LKPGEAIWAAAPEMTLAQERHNGLEVKALVKPGWYRIRCVNFSAPYDGPRPSDGVPANTQPYSGWIDFQVVGSGPRQRAVLPADRSAQTRIEAYERLYMEHIHAGGNVFDDRLRSRAPGTAIPPAKAEDVPAVTWGPGVDGLQAGVRLLSPAKTFAPGQAVWQEVLLRNFSQKDVTVSWNMGFEEQGRPTIKQSNGSPVKVLHFFGMGSMSIGTKTIHTSEIAVVGKVAVAFVQPDSQNTKEVAPGISFAADGMPLALAGPGRYSMLQTVYPLSADSRTALTPLTTGEIHVEVAGKPVRDVSADKNHVEDVSTAPIAWGPVKSGIQVGLLTIGGRNTYVVGERVRMIAILRNVTNTKIPVWHQTSFAFLDPPRLTDSSGRPVATKPAPENEWRSIGEMTMTGITFDMTYAPSADGPSRLRQTAIRPKELVAGYFLTAFIAPAGPIGARTTIGKFRIFQPVRLGLGTAEQLDTQFETGPFEISITDSDRPAITKTPNE